MKFEELILALEGINANLREQAIRAVNVSLTLRNWFFGFYIFEFEQNGHDRAEYGKGLLSKIADEMKTIQVPNSNERELRRYRQIYLTYPQFGELLSGKNEVQTKFSDENVLLDALIGIRGLSNPEFIDEKYLIQIRGMPSPELESTLSHYVRLINGVSYSHFVELIRVDDPLKRLFYETETLNSTWSVAELKRQISSLLYERTGLSKNKEKLLSLINEKSGKLQSADVIRDPYVFEFLGLQPRDVFQEKELEQALLDNLLLFILELGKGFCFEARQKRILIDNEHHYIDIVFYHRILHCHVLVDLKTDRFHYTHAGQMNMYLEYYKKYEMAEGDNPRWEFCFVRIKMKSM